MKASLRYPIFALEIVWLSACAAPVSNPPSPAQIEPAPQSRVETIADKESRPASAPDAIPSPARTLALPPEANVAAARLIFAAPDKTPLAWAELLVKNVSPSSTDYQHKNNRVTWSGVNGATAYVSHTDCSGLMNALLSQTYRLDPDDFKAWLGSRRPLAKNYFTAIETRTGFLPITNIVQVQPGALVVIRYLNNAPGDNTGHVLIVAAAPSPRKATNPIVPGTQQWDAPIIDSSKSGHGKHDTRRLADGTYHEGVGQGTMRLYADQGGKVLGYAWSDLKESTYYDASTRPLVIGRIDPSFGLPGK
jgi:hypothetical protein